MTSILEESKVAERISAAFIAAFISILFLDPRSSNSSSSVILKKESKLEALYRSLGNFDSKSATRLMLLIRDRERVSERVRE